MGNYIVSFFGNRRVSDRELVFNDLLIKLKDIFVLAPADIRYDDTLLYCGGYGDFGQIVSDAIDLFRKQNPGFEFRKIFVTPYITPEYKLNKYMKEFYDEILYPPLESVPPRLAISRRNRWMIDNSDLVIVYMEDPCGNTRNWIEYAYRRRKPVCFVAEKETKLVRSLLRVRYRKPE